MSNPFPSIASKPGDGEIYLALLPPRTPRLRTASYQYPLKLVSPAPVWTTTEPSQLVHTVYLLTYGGGLVAGDAIDLHITLETTTRLVLLTQGSTKVLRSPSRDIVSKQRMTVDLAPGSAICYLPDPVQPFAKSRFEQQQMFNVLNSSGPGLPAASLCVLDWVCNGREANGENWSFFRYGSRNEIHLSQHDGSPKLLLRDNIVLDPSANGDGVAARMNGMAVFGTLILHGQLFQSLAAFFTDEFKALPRIGGRKWDSSSESGDDDVDPATVRRAARQRQEIADDLLWSAAAVRQCIVVKFGAREVEGGRRWLRSMLTAEGSVVRAFGERAMLCLR